MKKIKPQEDIVENIEVVKNIDNIELEVAGVKIGPILKEARIKKNKNVEDIAEELKIRRVYLEAIEKSNYKEIPEAPYGACFVKTYAQYLGLDANQITNKFKSEINSDCLTKEPNFVEVTPVEAEQPNKKYLVLSLIALVAIYAFWNVFLNKNEDNNATEEVVMEEKSDQLPVVVEEFVAQPPVTEVIVEGLVEDETVVVAPVVVEPEPKPIAKIKVLQETWVEVKTPTKLYVSKVLYQGDEYKLPDDVGLILSVGKANGIEFYIGEKLVPVATANKKTNIALDSILNQVNN